MKKQNKVTRAVAASMACALVLTSSPIDVSAASKPAWKKTKSTMTVGEKYTFTIKNKPSKGSVSFTSKSKSVATVGSTSGKVTAKKAGKTVITAKVKNKKKKVVKTLTKNLKVVEAVKPTERPLPTPSVVETVAPDATPTMVPTATPVQSNNYKNWALVIDAKEKIITADGGDNTVLTFKMINTKTQKIDEEANDITLAVHTSFGELSNPSVTIKNGTGTLVLNSEFASTEVVAKITADISRESNNATDLIGKVSGEATVTFEPFKTTEDKAAKLVKTESNQADRVTLFFDREVSIDDFVVKNQATGTYKTITKNGITSQVFYSTSANSPAFKISQEDVNGSKVSYHIVGMATTKNKKALQLLITEKEHLDDNNVVNVTYSNTACGINSTSKFILTDAKKPEFTAIEAEGMKKVKITFSEAIPEALNKSNAAYTINGSTYKVGSVEYGTYDPTTAMDERAIVRLTLGKDEKKGTQQYFTAGKAILNVTNVVDYAGISDAGKNIISNQAKEFTIADDNNIPTAKVIVESPEQYRFIFTGDNNGKECPVVFTKDTNKTQIDALTYFSQALQVKVGKKYVPLIDVATGLNVFNTSVELGNDDDDKKVTPSIEATLASFLKVTEVSESEFVVELTEDWTKFYTTSLTKRNFYNDAYQFVFESDTVYNDNNGLTNKDDIVLSLNYSGSPMNQQDDVSPVVETILRTDTDEVFAAKMSEPVQFTTTNGQQQNITLSEEQSSQPAKAEFKGTNPAGDVITFYGNVLGYYGNDKKTDTMLELEAIYKEDGSGESYTIQQLVDRGYGTEWTVALTYVYDDVKNAAETKVSRFTVEPTEGLFSITNVVGTTAATAATTKDEIRVTFSQGISSIATALDVTRWKLDGYSLPEGTVLEVVAESGNKTIGYYTVKFTMPAGTIRKSKSHVLNVDKGIESIKKNILIGSYENKFVAQ